MGRNRRKWGNMKKKVRRSLKNLEKKIRGYRTKQQMRGM